MALKHLIRFDGVGLGPRGAAAIIWSIASAPDVDDDDDDDDDWSSCWNEKLGENLSLCHFVHHKFNMDLSDLETNPGRRGGKPSNYRLGSSRASDQNVKLKAYFISIITILLISEL
jgi:hypothetical protein